MNQDQTRMSPYRASTPALMVLVSLAIVGHGFSAAPANGLPEALAVKVRTIQKGLSEIRGHEYRSPIRATIMGEREVRAFLLRKLAHEYPDDKLAAEQITWSHFGFLGPDDDLKELFVGMLTEQAAGFYDPDDSRLIVVTGKAFPGLALVHELAHALADQIFDLGRLLKAARDNDDTLLAVSSMVEGEAQALSTTYVHAPAGAEMMDEDVIVPADSTARSQSKSLRIPPMLQHTFTFPYTQGMAWANEVVQSRGQDAMDAFYREPPESTEQIMHPEKSASPRDLPAEIPTGLLSLTDTALREAGYLTVKENVLGEFSIRELLGGTGDPSSGAAAAGWDGDRFRVLKRKDGTTAMIWITVWDTESDAGEFLEGITTWLTGRHPDSSGFRVVRSGPDGRVVRLVEGFEPELTDRIEAALAPAIAGKVTLR